MMAHEHIQAALMYELEKKLEEIQRRGVGYIDQIFRGGVDYKIDDTVYRITITEQPPKEET